jgi:hypothetical protein
MPGARETARRIRQLVAVGKLTSGTDICVTLTGASFACLALTADERLPFGLALGC